MKHKVKFINKDKTDFFIVLKQRVNEYFTENKISPHANGHMVIKTILMLALYYVPFAMIISGLATGIFFWLCWILAGLGLAGIGMSVMHDANHGAYSANKNVNTLLGYTLNLVGGDANNWKVQHNILHHTYTNIHGHDDDVNDKMGMRFSPAGKHHKGQRFQVVYALMLYSLMTLYWATAKDFVQFSRYIKLGHIKDSGIKRIKMFTIMAGLKIMYYAYMIVLPIAILDVAWWEVILGFLLLHAVAGLVLSIVFQIAHVVESTSFPSLNKEGNIENEWAIHQLHTTTDFAANNPFITFYVGGLNYQAIHHLFPRVCHIHYPKLAPIVAQTAGEYGIPYLYFSSFGGAFMSHLRLLKKLGRDEIRHMAADM